jgi:ABC-type ATPase with predicted acetyltransferase domain
MKYLIDKRFSSSVERTPRVLEIAEAFGLGLSNKEFVVFDNLEVEVKPGDVVYITGQSGSGKSLLLRDLVQVFDARRRSESRRFERADAADKPVIECLGKNTSQAADLLAKAGISDAWIYIRRPSEISDGQLYRLKLAMLMDMTPMSGSPTNSAPYSIASPPKASPSTCRRSPARSARR